MRSYLRTHGLRPWLWPQPDADTSAIVIGGSLGILLVAAVISGALVIHA